MIAVTGRIRRSIIFSRCCWIGGDTAADRRRCVLRLNRDNGNATQENKGGEKEKCGYFRDGAHMLMRSLSHGGTWIDDNSIPFFKRAILSV